MATRFNKLNVSIGRYAVYYDYTPVSGFWITVHHEFITVGSIRFPVGLGSNDFMPANGVNGNQLNVSVVNTTTSPGSSVPPSSSAVTKILTGL